MRFRFLSAILGCLLAVAISACSNEPKENPPPPWEVSGAELGLRTVDLRDFVPGCANDDCFRTLTEVVVTPTAQVDFLEDDDWVAVVEIDGAVRAYPLTLLWRHQGIHDTLAGRPILVSHSVLTGSTLVFEAKHDGEIRQYGVSRRFYNSSTVFYYMQPGTGVQVLLPQLYTASVTGSESPQTWPRIPSREMTWSTWQSLYPGGDVVTLDTGYNIDYSEDAYQAYRLDPDWIISPLSEPPDSRYPWKERTLLVRSGHRYRAYPTSELLGQNGPVEQVLDGVAFAVELNATGEFNLIPSTPAADLESYVAFWFACAAFHPDIDVYELP